VTVAAQTLRVMPKRMDHQPAARGCWSLLDRRLRRLGVNLTGSHRMVATVLFAHPGYHLSRTEVCCLLSLERMPFSREKVVRWLDDLVHWRVIQRIDVTGGHTFYDIDTRPQLHLFDPRTGTLRDGTVQGVVDIESLQVTVRIENGPDHPKDDAARRMRAACAESGVEKTPSSRGTAKLLSVERRGRRGHGADRVVLRARAPESLAIPEKDVERDVHRQYAADCPDQIPAHHPFLYEGPDELNDTEG
jgi:Fe2+ or Zn2+ uptake regulation protein